MTRPTILIVEDELPAAESMQREITSLGYEVSALASTGEEALHLAGQLRPELVLMDISLRYGMDGIEAASQIRQRFGIPVVFLTAHADEETWQRVRLSEPFGYLLKPIRPDSLRAAIEMALYKRDMDSRLRESEARYRLVSELTSDFAYALRLEPDGTWAIEWLTDAFSRITGLNPASVIASRSWTDLVHPDDKSDVRSWLNDALDGRSVAAEFRMLTAEGDTRWLQTFNYPVHDTDGRLTHKPQGAVRVFGAARDVTEQRQVSQALRRSAERLLILREIDQSILAARAPETIALVAIRHLGRLIPCRHSAVMSIDDTNRLGLLASESHGGSWPALELDVYWEMYREGVLTRGGIQGVEDLGTLSHRSSWQEVLYTAGVRSCVFVPLFVQGELLGTLNLESDQPHAFAPDHIAVATEVAASLAVAIRQARLYEQSQQEIAERMRAEERVRQQNVYLNTVLDSLNHPFYVLDANDYTILLANAAVRAHGRGAGMTCHALTHGSDVPCAAPDHPCPVDRVRETRQPVMVEHVHLDVAGTARLVELHCHPLFDEDGHVVRVIEYAIDITERKEAERAQREAAAAAERERLARDLHDAVTQTLFSASLIAEVLPQLWQIDVAEAERNLEKLRLLTRGALAEMRTLLLELRPAALTERPLADLLRHLGQALTSRTRVQVEMDLDQGEKLPPEVQIALYRIAQEALNNVARHSGAGRVIMTLRRLNGRVELGIHDDGGGFDLETIPPGHLGVSIMHERAAKIGAVLAIDSEIGRGTEVKVVWKADWR